MPAFTVRSSLRKDRRRGTVARNRRLRGFSQRPPGIEGDEGPGYPAKSNGLRATGGRRWGCVGRSRTIWGLLRPSHPPTHHTRALRGGLGPGATNLHVGEDLRVPLGTRLSCTDRPPSSHRPDLNLPPMPAGTLREPAELSTSRRRCSATMIRRLLGTVNADAVASRGLEVAVHQKPPAKCRATEPDERRTAALPQRREEVGDAARQTFRSGNRVTRTPKRPELHVARPDLHAIRRRRPRRAPRPELCGGLR